jgi:hypothetical protein
MRKKIRMAITKYKILDPLAVENIGVNVFVHWKSLWTPLMHGARMEQPEMMQIFRAE